MLSEKIYVIFYSNFHAMNYQSDYVKVMREESLPGNSLLKYE